MRSAPYLAALTCGLMLACPPTATAQVPGKYKKTIDKGLSWLVSQQNPRTGHFEGSTGQYPVAMTALAGMAMLSEGSTALQGKYAKNIRKARDYLMTQAQPSGLISNPNEMQAAARYMYGHGFATLFLASVYGEESPNEADMRKKLEELLTRAVKFTRDAQTNKGGWGYLTARDGRDFDEGSVTITQLQALRAARNAGIKVPPEAIKDAVKYLEMCTGPDGALRYSLAQGLGGPGRPALTAAAICCGFSAGEYQSPLVKKWFGYCKNNVPLLNGGGRMGHDEYTHYYYAQAMYSLGDDGWGKLFADDKENEKMTWKKYREITFETLRTSQHDDGSWDGHNWTARFGKVYVTACYLTMLQLDNNALPIYQR